MWFGALSLAATAAIGAIVMGTFGPGLDQMVTNQPRDSVLADLRERLSNPATPSPPPPPLPTPAPRVAQRRPAPLRAYVGPGDDPRIGRARLTPEPPRYSLRRQIAELEHLRDALEREGRQLERRARREDAEQWDPRGHRMRRRRLAELEREVERVERDLARLERRLDRMDD